MSMSRALARLLSLFIVAFGLFGLSGPALGVLSVLLLIGAYSLDRALPQLWWQRVMRLKWFFLAIFILYGVSGYQYAGMMALSEACYRVGVLVILVGCVAIAFSRIPPAELATGLTRLLSPLARLGVPVDSFSSRLAATLDAVNHMEAEVRNIDRSRPVDAVAAICLSAERFRMPEDDGQVEVDAQPSDWTLLFAAGLCMLALRLL